MTAADQPMQTLDIGRVLDEGTFSSVQKLIIAVVALAVVIDGFDSQLIGYAIPVIAKEWALPRAAFAPVVGAGLVGMAIGSVLAGWIADRFGRRWALVGSVLLFGIATCMVGVTTNLLSIGILRLIAGIGIGGALPSATTIAAEFSPRSNRTVAVTATIVCVPLGGMVAGLFASAVIPTSGWRPLFVIGGAIPVVFAILLVGVVPESPRFLARHAERWSELGKLLTRFGRPSQENVEYVDAAEQRIGGRDGFLALVNSEYRRDSVALWCAFFACMLTIYSAFSWLPTMLVSAGLESSVASAGLTAYNTGGVIGALVCAVLIAKVGSRRPLLVFAAAGAISALLLTSINLHEQTSLLIVGLGLHGLFVNAVQSTMYALCAHVYPTAIRATGTATAVMFGRLGAVVSSFAGAMVIIRAGALGYLTLLGVAMVAVFVSLAIVQRHVTPPQLDEHRQYDEELASCE